MITYLGIGTNLGDLAANLNRAVALIAEQAGHLLACSSYVKSEPWGFHSENIFLNAVVAIDTPHTPHELLAITQSIEKVMGRCHKSTNGLYTDRIIDIDILLYEGLSVDTPDLKIPHPYILERRFVYEPLQEIAPDIIDMISSIACRNRIQENNSSVR